MTEPLSTLERSLRDGPPDESGYRASRRELEIGIGAGTADRITPLQRVIPMPQAPRVHPPSMRMPIAALLVGLIAVGGFIVATRNDRSSVTGPSASRTPSANGTSTASPSPTPSSSPSPTAGEQPSQSAIPIPPLTTAFVSSRNGFSVKYPAEWTATPATESWAPDTFTQLGSPTLDELKLAGQARLVIASQRLGAGQTEQQWIAAYFRPFEGSATCAYDLATSPRLPIDGQSGYLDLAGCPISTNDAPVSPRDIVFEAFVFSGDRVYQITLDGDVDLAYFEALLATLKLDPASAIDPPSPS